MSSRRARNWLTLPLFCFFVLCCSAVCACAFEVVQQPSPTDSAIHAKSGLPVPADPKLPTLFLVGDGAGDHGGAGEPLANLFDTSKINIINRATGNRSSRTYITEGHWSETLALIKPGDIVIFQFGHDDSQDDPALAGGAFPGVGDDIREIDNPILKQHAIIHTYGWYIRQYVVETIAKGAIPILCSPVPRILWKDGRVVRNQESYGGWARQIAIEQRIGFIDIDEILAQKYELLGESADSQTSRAGAELNAVALVAGLKGLPHDPLSGRFSIKAATIQPYRPRPAAPMPALQGR